MSEVPLTGFLDRRGFWLRTSTTGPGVSVRWDRPAALFSERYGKRRVYRVGPFALELLARRAKGEP